jgi:hypothetical protein
MTDYKYKHEFKYHEFIDYVEKTPWLPTNETDSHDWSRSFTQTESFKEALDLAKYWWTSGIEEMKDAFKEISMIGNTEIEWNIAGWIVDVPKYLNGEPDCMIEFVDLIDREKPYITLYVPLWYNCGIDWDKALAFLKGAIKYIATKMSTHEVRIVGIYSSNQQGGDELIKVLIKDFNQNLVLNSFAFAFHPSFFRRLWFKHLETKKYWRYWYWSHKDCTLKWITESESSGDFELLPEVKTSWFDSKKIKTLKK